MEVVAIIISVNTKFHSNDYCVRRDARLTTG